MSFAPSYFTDPGYDETVAEIEANARLIAAAPDLLEACDPQLLEAAASLLNKAGYPVSAAALQALADRQRAAITKATGADQ